MSRAYVLSALAEADLRDIVRYSRKQWGDERTRAYVEQLERGADNLARGKGHYRDMSAIYPKLRVTLAGHHYVFCLPRADAPALVVAVLHERMDVVTRLRARFG
jgi:plasmid stabilization system protein ParE